MGNRNETHLEMSHVSMASGDTKLALISIYRNGVVLAFELEWLPEGKQ